ncbi:arginine-tRNA-protein transferase [Penicillium taxi]|uniref:arginine-tRNA-protein transferase n=1 Tax=Penicillium taxi TaxID=168475 RepID=UPI0025453D66|nr:arginine-tRNA-protein transferase [Penicillium taxi]KAJ5899315.1 arginine-tRNA-protein transferase [Penicillium taxi]
MEPVDAERARQLSLFRPLGTSHLSCSSHPLNMPQDTSEANAAIAIQTKEVSIFASSFATFFTDTSWPGASYYTSSVVVQPEHYEELINRGWRRSGSLYYKQNLQRSCCPQYTLRLEASAFHATRDQRKATNHWNTFVLGDEYISKVSQLSRLSHEENKHRKNNFDLLTRVHEAEYGNLKHPVDPVTKRPLEPAHRFEVNIEGDTISQAKYDLFVKYQTTIHREDLSRWRSKDFEKFLCAGIKRSPATINRSNDLEKKLGSWHQCYRLDGRLIAVAVLDLLPSGISSVYFFYDPDYDKWELGKLSALREIAFSHEHGYTYYYMGYYIHNCQKMRYKANFRPQYILDPETYTWDPLDGEFREKLDTRDYVSLSKDRSSTNIEKSTPDSAIDPAKEKNLSLFTIKMPGVLTMDEVTALNLDTWHLLFHGTFVEMSDLVGWETMAMDNPQSIKGIVSELAACLGPIIVQNSAVVLFD